MTEEEEFNKFRDRLIPVLKKEHARCRSWCTMWNSDDGDCEAMGVNHLTPSTCPIFLNSEFNLYKMGRLSDDFVQKIMGEDK